MIFNNRLKTIWRYRDAGWVEDSLDEYASLCRDLGITSDDHLATLQSQLMVAGFSREDVGDFWCFKASIQRRNLDVPSSHKRLDILAESLGSTAGQLPFQLCHQRALNALVSGEHVTALHHFQAAKAVARNDQEYLSSALNVILCMENIGLPHKDTLREFEMRFAEHTAEDWALGIREQLTGLCIRSAFYSGDWKALQDYMAKPDLSGQSLYQLALIAETPYSQVTVPESFMTRLQHVTIATPRAYLAEFRLGTIQYMRSKTDGDQNIRATEIIERLMLWIWKWLESPTHKNAQNVWHTLRLLFGFDSVGISSQEYQMLENAVRWIGLFLRLSPSQIAKILEPYQSNEMHPSSILRDEAELLDYIYSLGTSAEKACPNHFALKHERFRALQNTVESFKASRSHSGVTVCVVSRELSIGTEQVIYSRQLTNLLHLFRERSAATIWDVMAECFGMSSYVAHRHASKISALISRANAQIPGADFRRRDDIIYSQSDVSQWMFVESSAHHLSLYETGDRGLAFGAFAASSQDETLGVAEEKLEKWVSRADLERNLGMSRATINRRLKTWEIQGHCVRRGHGKATSYLFKDDFLQLVAAGTSS